MALKEAKEVASNTADTFVEEVYHSSGMSQQQGGVGGRQPNLQTRDRWFISMHIVLLFPILICCFPFHPGGWTWSKN